MKNNDYWEKALTVLPDSYKSWFYEEKKYLENYLTNNARVLEVGCGDGRSIYDILDITSNITGVDYDKNAVKQAKKHFSEYPNVNIFQANAESLPFEKEQFDFVICMTTFANFAEKKLDVLSEMKRVLRIDGKIIISVFSESALEERMKVYSQVGITIDRIHEGVVYFENGSIISEQFSKGQLEEIFSKVELSIADITKIDIAYLCTLTK